MIQASMFSVMRWRPDEEALVGGHRDADEDEDVEEVHHRPHDVLVGVAEDLVEGEVVV